MISDQFVTENDHFWEDIFEEGNFKNVNIGELRRITVTRTHAKRISYNRCENYQRHPPPLSSRRPSSTIKGEVSVV